MMDSDRKILEESSHNSRHDEATEFAKDAKAKYAECQAVCKSTGNHWIKTADALEKVEIPLELANPFKTKAIAWASIKNDKVDARTLAHLLRPELVASCHTGNAEFRGKRQLIRHAIRRVHDRTRVINLLHSLTDIHVGLPADLSDCYVQSAILGAFPAFLSVGRAPKSRRWPENDGI